MPSQRELLPEAKFPRRAMKDSITRAISSEFVLARDSCECIDEITKSSAPVYIYIYIYIYMYVCMYVCMYVYIHIYSLCWRETAVNVSMK